MPTLHSPAKAARSFAAIMGPLRYSGGVLGAPTAGDESPVEVSARDSSGGPNGIRTRVSALRGPCPGPLDDGAGRTRQPRYPKISWLGEEDSNPRCVVQSHVSYH